MNLYTLNFTTEAIKTLSKYKKSNPTNYKKLIKLFDELMEHPRIGIGHPEPLKTGNSITYSRRITKKDRIIYDIYDETVTILILALEGHYYDK